MTTLDFLKESEHALTLLFDAIWHERVKVEELEPILRALEQQTDSGYSSAEFAALNALDADEVAMAAGMHWETYFGSDKERHSVANQVDDLRGIEDAHRFSRSALAGAVLQIAKQAISVGHGAGGSKLGRLIGTHPIGNIVRQSRNQSMHWEEGRLANDVLDVFSALHKLFPGRGFDDPKANNLAFEVLDVLAWKSISDLEMDMKAF